MSQIENKSTYSIASNRQPFLYKNRAEMPRPTQVILRPSRELGGPFNNLYSMPNVHNRVVQVSHGLTTQKSSPKNNIVKTDAYLTILTNYDFKNTFEELYAQWREQTKFDSFINSSTNNYHEKIVQLGYAAVPFIIDKLKIERPHLFIALNRITGKNPVKEENKGIVKKMAEDWIQWWDSQP